MRILVFRKGAFGDVLITTPALKLLKQLGHKVVYVANERGVQVLRNNPNIDKLIEDKTDSVPSPDLAKKIQYFSDKNNCDLIIDYSESIEVALAQHPRGPGYKLPKYERLAKYNKNYYEYCVEWTLKHLKLDMEWNDYRPELFFKDKEINEARKYLKKDKFNILLGMSGSGTNKTWPWNEELCEKIVKEIPNAHIITVGDERCKMIEPEGSNITNLSGKVSMRTSMALTGLLDLIISPDTGLLHASGCYDTPKIGILGHNTIQCISKHFSQDYSVMADEKLAPCAPCLFLIYNMSMQCPIHETGAALCMGAGIVTDKVMGKVMEVYGKHS